MAKQIVNGVEYSNEFDPQIYAKIGTSQLETQADNLSDGVNELKQSLSDLFTTRTITVNVSVTNEWFKNQTYTPPTIDGYTPIAIQSWFCGAVDYYPIKVSLDSVYIVRYVHTAETKNITFNLTILYAKTSVL